MTEGPYELPEGWRWVRLGEVCKVFAGSPAPQGEQYFRDGHFLFVRVQDLGRHGITTNLVETADLVNEKAAKELRLKKAKAGTILFPKSGAAILTNSRAILGKDAYIVSHLAAVEPNTSFVHNLWVFYWLCTVDMSQFIDNPAYPSLRLSKIKELYLPLPPLSEQRRIVARIEELMERIREARRLREEACQDTDRLWQSVLAEIFPRPGDKLPEGWRWVRLGEVCSIFSGVWGNDPSEPPPPKMKNVKVIRVSDIKENLTIDYKAAPLRLVKQDEAIKYALRHGDLVVVKSSGSMAKVISGRTALFQEQDKIYIPSNFTFALRPKQDMVSSLFLWYWLNAEPAKVMVKGMVSAFTYPNLKKADYIQMLIPLPPLSEQRRIVAHLEAVQERIQALKEKQAATEAELKRLERAILEKAFRGEL